MVDRAVGTFPENKLNGEFIARGRRRKGERGTPFPRVRLAPNYISQRAPRRASADGRSAVSGCRALRAPWGFLRRGPRARGLRRPEHARGRVSAGPGKLCPAGRPGQVEALRAWCRQVRGRAAHSADRRSENTAARVGERVTVGREEESRDRTAEASRAARVALFLKILSI